MRRTFIFTSLAITAAIVLVVASVTYVLFNIDGLIKDTIISDASRAYKVPVTVSDAKMSLKTGEGQIIGLRIANPPGFGAPTAIHIPFIGIEVDTDRIAAKAIGVRRVVLEKPKIVLQIKEGRVNLVRLRDSVRAWVNRSKIEDEDASKGQMFIIDQVLLQNGSMVFRADFLDGLETEVALPDTRIKDIGAETGGALPAEVIEAVTNIFIKAAERASRRIDLEALAKKNEIPVPDVNISGLLKE